MSWAVRLIAGLASSAAGVTFIPVLHERGEPRVTIFIWRLDAICMSSVLFVVLFLTWLIFALPLHLTVFSKPP